MCGFYMDAHKNFAYSTVATAPSPASSGTSLVVQTGDGAKFPTPPFNATVWPAGQNPTNTNAEIVRVTNITTDSLTITRLQESSSARSILVGDQIAATITVKTITDIENNYLKLAGGVLTGEVSFSGTGIIGLKVNSLTTTQINALSHGNGQIVYDSTLNQLKTYGVGGWTDISKNPATKVVAPSGSGYEADFYTTGTNDDIKIQSAIDTVNSAGGGIVLIKAGSYSISSTLKIRSNVIILGEGISTVLTLANSANVDMINSFDTINGHDNAAIKNFLIDGNKTNQSSIVNIINITNSRNILVQNLLVQNATQHGILFDGSLTARIAIKDNVVHDSANCGIGLVTATTQVLIEGNQVYSNGQANIAIIGFGSYITINNNFCKHAGYGSTTADNITGYNDSNNHITVTNNQCLDSNNHGIHFAGTGIVITGNQVDTAQFEGIRIESHSGTLTVVNTIVSNNSITNVRNGLYLSNVSNITAQNNTVTVVTQDTIHIDNVTNSEIQNNSLVGTGTNLSGIRVHRTKHTIISGNTIKNNVTAGIQISDDNTTISTYNSIYGNTIYDDQGTKTQAYAILSQNSSDWNYVFGNYILATDEVTNNISLAGSNNIIGFNAGYPINNAGRYSTTGQPPNTLIQGMGSQVASTDTAGGQLNLSSGISTGNAGSVMIFLTASDGLGTGTTDRTPTEKMRLTSSVNGRLAIGTSTFESGSDGITFGGTVPRQIHTNRQPGSVSAGNSLTLIAGGASLGGTDKAGGNLILQSGIATGLGSSSILFKTSTPQASTNTTDNSPITQMTLTGNGQLFIGGSTTPTAVLHLAAGVSTVDGSPLKFTSGTNLSTPENGAMEYNGTHLYFTIGSTRYQIDQQPGSGSVAWGSISGTLSSQTDLQTALNGKEPSITSGTTAQYWRGDKSFQTLDTLAVAENTNLYFTNARVQANRLDQMTPPNTTVNMNSERIINLQDPTNPQDAASKNYVDTVAQGLSVKPSVQAATVAALPANTYSNGSAGFGATLTQSVAAALVVDGYTVALNDRILVQNEGTASHNGIYVVTTLGTGVVPFVLTRATDMDIATKYPGAFTFVENGTVNADSGFVCTSVAPITVGTTAINFTQFSGAGEITAGTGLSKSGNTISIATGYVGQTSIITLGTITTGTWTGTTIAIANGGTNNTSAYTSGSLIYSDGTKLTQDNANLFYDATNKVLAIGTNTPNTYSGINSAGLQISNNSGIHSDIVLQVAGGYGNIYFASSNGTIASPTATAASNGLGALTFKGFDGTNYKTAGFMGIQAANGGSFSSTSMPGDFLIQVAYRKQLNLSFDALDITSKKTFGVWSGSLTNAIGNFQVFQPGGSSNLLPGLVQTAGTTALVGTETFFTNDFKIGDLINVSGETVRTVATITDDTHLTVTVAFSTSASNLTYYCAQATLFTIRGYGHIGIGTTTPGTNTNLTTAALELADNTNGANSDMAFRVAGASGYGNILMAASAGTLASPTVVGSNRVMGTMTFLGHDGNNYQQAAMIVGGVDVGGSVSAGSMPGTIQFWTTPDSAVTPVRQIIIDRKGRIGFGGTYPTQFLDLKAGTATAGTAPLKFTAGTNLTSAISGVMEYDGTNFYLTDSNPTRRTVLYADLSNITGTLAVANGGTGQTSYTDGQLLIGNSSGNTLTKATITAGNSVTVTNGHGTITLDTIQDIRTSATPTFAGINLGTSNLSTVGNIRIDGSAARDITVGQNSGATGQNLTIISGNSIGTGTNEAGGALILSSNVGTGNNTSSFIAFYTSTDVGSGTTLQTTSEKMRLLSSSSGRLLIGTTTNVSGGDGIILGGAVARTIQMVRQSGSTSAGNSLTIFAGGASSGGTDKAGGNLILKSGTATGTGSSIIQFQTSKAQASTNTTDNALATVMTLDGNGRLFVGGTTNPSSVLHLAAGSATANTAPLQFTSGTLETTARAGLHEYNGNHYLTSAGLVRYSVGGTIFDHFADAGNTHTDGSTFDDLYTDTTVANTFNTNGDKIIADYSGIFVGSTATKEVKVLFAGTTILDSTALAIATNESWDIDVLIIRESSTVVRCMARFISTTATLTGVNTEITYTRITGLTLSGTNILKITGVSGSAGAAANDVVAKMGTILFLPAV